MSLMYVRMSISNNIKTTLLKTDNGKDMLKFVEERSQIIDKSLVVTLMSTLTTMKFDGSHTMHEHVIEIINSSARLKTLGMEVDASFLVWFILNSLLPKYGPFQMNYNTIKDKWNVYELHIMLLQEDTRLKDKGIHSINYGIEKKKGNMQIKEKNYHVTMSLLLRFIKRGLKLTYVIFVIRLGLSKKDCPKRKTWFEKKVNIMLMCVSNQILMKFLTILGGLILDVQLMFLI